MTSLVVARRNGQMIYWAGANETDLGVFGANRLLSFDRLHTSSGSLELLLSIVLGLLRGSFSQTTTEAAPGWPWKVGLNIAVLTLHVWPTTSTSPASSTSPTTSTSE